MRFRPNLRAMLLSLTLLVASVASAQEFSIVSSEGAAELLLPGEGWRQAVSGRLVPEGASVAAWVYTSVVVGRADVQIRLGELSLMTLIDNGAGEVTIDLIAGSLEIEASNVGVTIVTESAKFRTGGATFRLEDNVVSVDDGDVEIVYPDGKVRQISAGLTISLDPFPLAPIVYTE